MSLAPTLAPPAHPGIAGSTALVTGASRGIGARIAAALAAAGATVVLTGRDRVALEAATGAAGAIASGAAPVGLVADLTVAGEVEGLRRAVRERVGTVDLLVAAAGGLGEPVALVDTTDAQWHATVDANLTATFHTLRAFLPGMIERQRGAVVTIASTAGQQVSRASAAYGAANAGLLALTRQAASQVAGDGVRVNAVSPGSTRTERLDARMPTVARERLAATHPLGRMGEPDDVARAVLFLLGDDASWITGATLDVNGGSLMR